MKKSVRLTVLICLFGLGFAQPAMKAAAEPYLDNETIYTNQDPNNETRRSEHFHLNFGLYNWDTGTPMTEQFAQGNLQMFERMWNRWVIELGMHDINESATQPDGKKYRANFNFLMTRNDGGGGGAYMSMDGNGFCYAMSNTGYARYDPPSGATPHEFGHVWEGTAAGFNGTDSSGMWWECTANWMQLQFLNSYPQPGALLWNSMYYPAHGRDYYDSYAIWEAARDDPRYGGYWVSQVWSDATPDQQVHEYIVDRMVRVDTSGSPDKTNANRNLWGDMAKKCVTWDYERQQWFAQINNDENSADANAAWGFYQRCRTPLVKMPGTTGWYRPERSHLPMEYGFNIIPLTAAAGATVSCNFQPQCDPVRQSDWRACLVAVSNNNNARYSSLWNTGVNSIQLSSDEAKLFLVVIATPKPMKVFDPMWAAYLSDSGLQFPYALSFTNATPKNVVFPVPGGLVTHANGGGKKSGSATVAASAYIGPNAMVLDNAQVLDNARIEDYAVVRNNAQVRDNAVVSGHGMVQDSAQVYGNAKVRDWGRVFGDARIYENARVIEHANCGDGGNTVFGSAVVKGTTYVYSPSTFNGSLIVDGDSANGNGTTVVADHGVHFGWQWGQNTAIFPGLVDNGYIYAQHDFEMQNGLYAAGKYGTNGENAVFAMDKYGINHGFLMNGARAGQDTAAPVRGGLVLPLDGVSQYVELHNSVNDFRETAVTVWVKWTGTANDQCIWSMGDGSTKVMYLTPKNATSGKIRFSITDGATTQNLDGAAAMPANVWTHVAVVFSGTTGILYVNGVNVASNTATLFPDSLNAPLMENANYLGRGNAGNYFQGFVDDFRVYMKALTAGEIAAIAAEAAPAPVTIPADTTAPTPNAAAWLIAPTALGDSAISMSATPGADASGWVEYYFTCTSGGGHDSGWVSFTRYTDLGLAPGTVYTYTVKMRDKNGNTTAASAGASAATQISAAPAAAFANPPAGIANGQVGMAAEKIASPSGLVEYKFDRIAPSAASSGWQASPSWTDTGLGSGVACSYTVTARDGRGNTSAPSDAVATTASDKTPPKMPIPVAHWGMLPYATIDNKVSMTANDPADGTTGIQYQFICTNGALSTSTWQASPTYLTAALPDGAYTFRYRVRDAALNASPLSVPYVAVITPTSGYHNYSMPLLSALPDDYLVSFNGVIIQVNPYSYVVKDPVTGVSYTVEDSASKYLVTWGGSDWVKTEKTQTTDPANLLKNANVKGHLYTRGGIRLVTFATVTPSGSPLVFNITGKVTDLGGANLVGAAVYVSNTPNASANAGFTATTVGGGTYTVAVPDGNWYICAGSPVHNTSADQVVAVAGANVPNINFTLVGNVQMSGTVTQLTGGAPINGATVYFSRTPGASNTPIYTATSNGSGVYTRSVQDGTWYVCAGATGFYVAQDQIVAVNGADVSNINFALQSNVRNIPRTTDLLFGIVTDSLPASGAAGAWPVLYPSGMAALAPIGSPTVETIDGVRWARNYRNSGDTGFQVGRYAAPIACAGVTIIAAVKPAYVAVGGEPRGEIVDIFYDRLALAISHTDGRVMVARNYWNDWGPAIPEGQKTILSLTVQTDGSYKVHANGAEIMTGGANGDWTSINPDHTADWGNDPDFTHYITVGRNAPDGWSAYNGNIGDVFLYNTALSDAERQQLEADLTSKFLGTATAFPITATAGVGGTISPAGTVNVNVGANQAFTISALADYAILDARVDGVSVGTGGTYTFNNVTASHSIAATFRPTAFTITASAGPNGTITPAGAVGVASGGSKYFTIAPLPGYSITDVLVDTVSVGAVGSYTFTNVTANRTISATFSQVSRTITASAGPNGTITPNGVVTTDYATPKTFTITPAAGYAIADVLIDSVSVGAITTCTFVNVTANHTISATFKTVPPAHTITGSAGTGGTIDPDGPVSVEDGANRSVVITPEEGYALQDVLVDGVSAGTIGNYTFVNVTADHTISAAFKSVLPVPEPTFVITASAGTGGTISPSGAVTVTQGADQIFMITPDPGSAIVDVVVDEVSVGAVGMYTFKNVTENHSITVRFTSPTGAKGWETWR